MKKITGYVKSSELTVNTFILHQREDSRVDIYTELLQ